MGRMVDRGSYKSGGKVQQTGIAKLHKGEVVIPAKAAKGWAFDDDADDKAIKKAIKKAK